MGGPWPSWPPGSYGPVESLILAGLFTNKYLLRVLCSEKVSRIHFGFFYGFIPVLLVSHSPSSLSFATLLNPSLPLTHHCSFFCTPLSSLLLCFFLLLHFSCHPYPLFLLPSLLYNLYLTFPSPSVIFHSPSPSLMIINAL